MIEEDTEGENRESRESGFQIAVVSTTEERAKERVKTAEKVVINKTIEASSSGYPLNRESSAVDSCQSRNPSDSSMRNTTVDEEEEKAFIEKYFSKQERRGNSLTPEMLKNGRRRLTSVVEAKERLKK